MSTHPSSTPTPTPDPEDAWLEKLLRQPTDTAAPDGEGTDFTARVLAALPPPASLTQRAMRRRRVVLVGAAAILGGGFAWLCGGPGLAESALEISRLTTHAAVQTSSLNSIAVEVLAAASAIAMLWFSGFRNLRRLF